jgi:hypothetical protein
MSNSWERGYGTTGAYNSATGQRAYRPPQEAFAEKVSAWAIDGRAETSYDRDARILFVHQGDVFVFDQKNSDEKLIKLTDADRGGVREQCIASNHQSPFGSGDMMGSIVKRLAQPQFIDCMTVDEFRKWEQKEERFSNKLSPQAEPDLSTEWKFLTLAAARAKATPEGKIALGTTTQTMQASGDTLTQLVGHVRQKTPLDSLQTQTLQEIRSIAVQATKDGEDLKVGEKDKFPLTAGRQSAWLALEKHLPKPVVAPVVTSEMDM